MPSVLLRMIGNVCHPYPCAKVVILARNGLPLCVLLFLCIFFLIETHDTDVWLIVDSYELLDTSEIQQLCRFGRDFNRMDKLGKVVLISTPDAKNSFYKSCSDSMSFRRYNIDDLSLTETTRYLQNPKCVKTPEPTIKDFYDYVGGRLFYLEQVCLGPESSEAVKQLVYYDVRQRIFIAMDEVINNDVFKSCVTKISNNTNSDDDFSAEEKMFMQKNGLFFDSTKSDGSISYIFSHKALPIVAREVFPKMFVDTKTTTTSRNDVV